MAGKTNTKPIFIKSLKPIESSTQDESVPVEIVQEDKEMSLFLMKGVILPQVCLLTRK